MKNNSLWQEYQEKIIDNITNEKNISTDILIIGAGITGIMTAYFLKDSNNKITIIDKSKIGTGITSKTTAKLTYLEQDIYRKLTSIHGNNIAKKYYNSQKEAIDIFNSIIEGNNIDCDKEKVSSVLFTNNKNNFDKLTKERNILSSYGEKTKEYKDNYVKYGFIVDNTYTFNPIKYLNEITKLIKDKVSIYENIIATSIKKYNNKYIVNTNKYKIIASKIVLACHYPFFIIPFLFPIKTHIEREYVNVSKINEHKKITLINIDKQLYSVRYYKDYLIYASHNHLLTNKIDYANNYKNSQDEFKKQFHKRPLYTWINQDIISNDLLPFIGEIKENIYISTAYNTWGMTNSIIGAKLLSDLIQNKENSYVKLFNPNRLNVPLVFNSLVGIFNYLKVYIESLFHKSNPYYVKIKGILYGIYVDKNGVEHKVKLICPHMKCSLVFNDADATWDCPCHGSRFDIDGNIINSPAIKKIS